MGSNVRGGGLAKFHAKEFNEIVSALTAHREIHRQEAAKLVSRRELLRAIKLSERTREEQDAANFGVGPQAAAWRANKAKSAKEVARELSKNVRGFKQLRRLARVAQQDFDRLARKSFAVTLSKQVGFKIGQLPELQSAAEVFAPPFSVFDVSENNAYPNQRNDSLALPRIGHVLNNLHVSLDEHTSILNGIFGLDGLAFVINRAGCGFNFTVPRRGRLRIITELQHFFTRIRLTLSDNFGFSSGEVSGSSLIYINIIRGAKVVELAQTMVFDGLISHGSDLTTVLPSPKIGTIFTFNVTTEEIFEAGTDLQIIAGCQFRSGATVDDMEAIADALLWHKVRRIAVEVV